MRDNAVDKLGLFLWAVDSERSRLRSVVPSQLDASSMTIYVLYFFSIAEFVLSCFYNYFFIFSFNFLFTAPLNHVSSLPVVICGTQIIWFRFVISGVLALRKALLYLGEFESPSLSKFYRIFVVTSGLKSRSIDRTFLIKFRGHPICLNEVILVTLLSVLFYSYVAKGIDSCLLIFQLFGFDVFIDVFTSLCLSDVSCSVILCKSTNSIFWKRETDVAER